MEEVTMERRETSLLPKIELKETRNEEAKTVYDNNEEKQINKEQSFTKEEATDAKKEEAKTVNGNNEAKQRNEEPSFSKEEAKETKKAAAAAAAKEKDAAAETKTASEFINGSSEEERNKVRLMRALVQKQDSSSKDVDDFMMRRFLRARDMDVDKASSMLLKYLKWRQTFVPEGSISASEIPNDLAQNKMFLQGKDKKGRPVTVVFGGRHFHNKGGLDEFKRFVVFALQKLCARMPTGQEKFVFIGDLQGWGYSNSDIRGYLAALTILQDYYPERLGKLFIVHVPYMFMAVWKVVYPFIDDNTKKKIVFVEDKKLKTTLLEDIEESQIPDIYGGKLPLVPIQDS